MVLSSAQATLTEAELATGGSLTVNAENEAEILADNTATITSGGTAVGVTLAFNTLGWEPQNIFSKAADALLGGDIGTEQPVDVLARIENTVFDVGGDLTVTAAMTATIDATTSNEASSEGGTAASMVLATNKVSSGADAYILMPEGSAAELLAGGDVTVDASDAPSINAGTTVVSVSAGGDAGEGDGEYFAVDFNSADGEQEIDFGVKVLVAEDHEAGGNPGRIYRYLGGEATTADLTETDYADTGYWHELLPPVGFVGNVLGFLESEMPYQEKEFILTSIPIGGEDYDIGFAIGGGWPDLTVQEFLDGKGAKTAAAGFDTTDTGFSLGVGSLFDRVGPELRVDFRLPDPQMPYEAHDLVLGTIEHGGQSFEWGLRTTMGWPDTTLLQMINLPALLKGRFDPVLPEFGATVFFGDVEIDSLQFLPSKFVLRIPTLQVTLFGNPVQIVHGGAIEIDTPESLADFVDPDRDPMVIELDPIDLDVLLGAEGVEDRAEDCWDDAIALDINNPDLPYFQQDLVLSSVDLAGQSWDIGLRAGIGWQDKSLFEMFMEQPAEGSVAALETGVSVQAPGYNVLGESIQGPQIYLELLLPNPSMPYAQYRQAATGGALDGAAGAGVDWGIDVAVGWSDVALFDLVDAQAWADGELRFVQPELALSIYADAGATSPFLPSSFEVSLAPFKVTVLGQELLLDFGDSITIETPAAYAHLVDPGLAPGELSLSAVDLDEVIAAMTELDPGAHVSGLEAYEVSGDEVQVNVLDPGSDADDSVATVLAGLIKVIHSSFVVNDLGVVGTLLGVDVEYTLPVSSFLPEELRAADSDESTFVIGLQQLLPENVYQALEPYIDDASDPVEAEADPIEFGRFDPNAERALNVLGAIGVVQAADSSVGLPWVEHEFRLSDAGADFESSDGSQWVEPEALVKVAADHEAGVTAGRIYRYLGEQAQRIDL